MKLHLPKALFTAVIAAFAVSQTAWGGWDSEYTDTYIINNGDTITELSTSNNAGDNGAFIRAGEDAVTASITTLTHVSGKKLTLTAGLDDASFDLAALTIGTLNIGDGSSSADLSIGTSQGSATESQNVTINTLNGSIGTLTVNTIGNLTLGTVSGTIGTVTMGTDLSTAEHNLLINGATGVIDTVNACSGTFVIAYTGQEGITVKKINAGNNGNARGDVLIKENAKLLVTEFWNHQNNTSSGIVLEKNATLVLSDVTIKGLSNDTGSLATVDRHNGGGKYVTTEGNYTISNALVEYDGTLGTKLTNVSLNHATEGTLTVTNSANTLNDISVSNGTVNVSGASDINSISMTGGTLNVTCAAVNSDTSISLTGGNMTISGTTVNGITVGTGDGVLSISNSTISGTITSNGNLTLGNDVTGSSATLTGTGNITIDRTLSGSISLTGGTIVLNSDFARYTTKESGELTYSLTGEDGSFTASTDANGFAKQTSSSYWLIQGDASGSTISSATYGDGEITISSDDTGAWFKFDDAVVSHDFYITTGSVDVTSAAQARAERYILNGDTALMNVTEGSVSANDIVINNIGQGIALAETATLTDVSAADDADATLLAAVSGTGTIEVAGGDWNTSIAPSEAFAGTLYVTSGKFTYNTSNIGKTLKLASGTHFQLNAASTLEAGQTIVLESGDHEMHINDKTDNSFTILGTVSGEGTLVRKGSENSEKYAYIQGNASVSNFNNTTGYLDVSENASVTNLSISGGTANINTTGFIEKLASTGGITNVTGNVTVGTTGKSGRTTGLYAHTGTLNIGDGSTATKVIATRLESGDADPNDVKQTGGIVNVKAQATLVITATEDKLGDTGQYKYHGLMIGAWNGASILNIDGAMLAPHVQAATGDSVGTININDGGLLAVKGIRSNVADKQSVNLNLGTGSKLILGSEGITNLAALQGSLGAGTVGISADSVTIAENIALSSTSGTTFDTTKYVWGEDGTSIAQGTEGGELTVSGTISDHSVTTTEGEGETAVSSTTTYPGKLIVTGAGKLTITSSNNTYSGGTSVQGGTLTVSAASSLGTGDIEVLKDAVLEIDTSSGGTIQGAVNLKQASTLTVKNGYGSSTINATINVEDSATIESGWGGDYGVLGGTINGSGVLSLACPKWGDGYSTNAWKLTSTISDESADSTLAITSSTNVTISGTNTYSGGTTITERTLTAANESALGTGKVTVDGGTLTQTSALKVSELEYKNGAVSNAGNALEADKLTIASGATMSGAGAGTVTVNDTLTISSANAFSLGGALVLTDATVDLSGFTVDTELTESTYVFTLGTAAGGITGVTADGFVYTAPEGYTATLAAISANEAAGVMTLADGDTAVADTLVLTLTAPSDTPETLTTLTVNNPDGATLVNGVLTLKTVESAENAVFGDNLNITITDEAWTAIKDANTLPDEIAFSFVGSDGTTFDFDGVDGSGNIPTITINGVGTVGEQTLSGEGTAAGTIVGNYVTAYIPEPTTTTLSLLALAGLAVRRRRR